MPVVSYFSVLDLYSGPGGLSEGFAQARTDGFRFNVVAANDANENAVATYKKNHPYVKVILGDLSRDDTKDALVRAVKKATGGRGADIVIGGPPCQGFSLSNKKSRNSSNPLNDMVHHFVNMVERIRPFAFVMENVPGMLSLHNGALLDRLVEDLLLLGYDNAKYWMLNAADYGVPQKRRRVFLVGSKGPIDIKQPRLTHMDIDSPGEYRNLFPHVTVHDAIGDLPRIPIGKSLPSNAAYRHAPKNSIQHALRRNAKAVTNHLVTVSKYATIKKMKCVSRGGNWRDIPKGIMRANGCYKNPENTHTTAYRRLDPGKPSVTVANFRKAMLIHPTQNRLLSVREAARIQTFPDSFEFCGTLASMQQQVSDAVPVILARSVGEAMLVHMKNCIMNVKVQGKNENHELTRV